MLLYNELQKITDELLLEWQGRTDSQREASLIKKKSKENI